MILSSRARLGFCIAALMTLTVGCSNSKSSSSSSAPAPTSIQVSWSANHDAAVNSSGGGYRVYYSKSQGFDIASASSVDVPYQSGTEAPTSTIIRNLDSGTSYYIKVTAYSALVPPGKSSGAVSSPSSEVKVTLPAKGNK